MLVVQCQCGKTLTVPEGSTARRGVCPNCGQMLKLPRTAPRALAPTHLVELTGHQGPVRTTVFSPDGRLLASVGGSETAADDSPTPRFAEIRLWDVERQRAKIAVQGHVDTVLCAAFTPDSQILITGSKDQTLIVWDVSRGMHDVVLGLREHSLRGHVSRVTAVSVSPDGSYFVSGSDDGEIRLWNTTQWRCDGISNSGRTGICRLQHSADGRMLAGVWRSKGASIIWDAKTQAEYLRLALMPEEDAEDYDLAWSPDGAFLAVLSANGLRIWDLSSCQVSLSLDASGMRTVAWSPDGRYLIAGGWELKTKYDVQIWDALTGEPLQRLNGQHNALYTVCFSPTGDELACAGRDLAVHLWRL